MSNSTDSTTLPRIDLSVVSPAVYDDLSIIRLAREMAMGLRDFPDILTAHGLTSADFERIRQSPRFTSVLTNELTTWEAARNAPERIKLKTAHMIEEWLPDLYLAMSDRKEALSSRVKAGELAAKLAGIGNYDAKIEANAADRVQITINMGATKLEVNKSLPGEVTRREDYITTSFHEISSPGTDHFKGKSPSKFFDEREFDDGLQASVEIDTRSAMEKMGRPMSEMRFGASTPSATSNSTQNSGPAIK